MGWKVRSETKRKVEMRAGNNRRRHLRLESLESRHLLSVSVPIGAAHDFADEQATEVGSSLQNVAVPQFIVAPLSASASSFSTVGFDYNGRLQEWLPEFSGGNVNLGGVPFSIPATGNNVWHSADPWTAGPNPRTLSIPVNLFGAQRVYTLVNAWWGETAPGTYASITFVGSAGATYVFDLDGNSDVRDYFHGNHANAINGTTTTNVFSAGAKRIDMQAITLPEAFHTQILTSIQVTDNGINWFGVNDPIQQRIYLAGLTVDSVPSGVHENWSHIVSGNGQPVFNGQVFSTTNGNTWAVNSYPPTPDFNVSLTPGGIRMQAPPSPTPFLAREYILSNSNQAFQNLVAHTTVTLTSPPVAELQGAGLLARGNVSLGNGYALLIVPGSAELVRIDGFVAHSLQSFSIPQVVSGRTYGMRLVANGSDLIGIIYDGSLTGPTIGVLRASDSTYATAGATGLVGASIAQAPSIDATFGALTAIPLGTVAPTVGGLTATPTGTTSVRVRWNRTITTNDPYYLERATSPDGPFTQIAILDATKTFYVDNGSHLNPNTPYYYRLWALSNNVPSPYSAVADAKTFADPTQFNSGPRIISPASGSFGTLAAPVSYIDVTFSEPIDPTSFTPADVSLRRGTAIIPVQQPTHQGDNVWRIPFISQSVPGTYTLIVGPYVNDMAGNSMNQNGNTANGEQSADRFVSTFHIAPILPPGTPQGLTAQLTGNSAVALDWSDVAGADSYSLYRSTSPTGPWEFQKPLYQGSQSQHHDVGSFLAPGQKYYYAVRASNSGGYSALSSFVSVTIPLSAPLGLDRWWATAGDEYLPVTWTVEVPEAGDLYSLNVLGGWGLNGSRVVVLTEPGLPTANFYIHSGGYFVADLPQLSPGVHQFLIDAFHVPSSVGLRPVTLSLSKLADPNLVATMTTTLIADHSNDISRILPRNEFRIALLGNGVVLNSPEELVQHFAPILHFEKDERYAVPFPVERSLAADLTRDDGLGSNAEVIDLTALADGIFRPDNSPAAIYASLLYNPDRQEIAINYYFHYPMSNWGQHGGLNNHQGDWEGVSIFLKQSRHFWIPDRIALAQHIDVVGFGGGQQILWVDMAPTSQHGGERVELYIGLGGHATYAHADTTPIGLYDEQHRGGITYVPNLSDIEYLPRIGSPEAKDWLRFPGYWGLQEGGLGASGPRGPVFQNLSVGTDASGLRWLNPWGWSGGFDWFVPPALASAQAVVEPPTTDESVSASASVVYSDGVIAQSVRLRALLQHPSQGSLVDAVMQEVGVMQSSGQKNDPSVIPEHAPLLLDRMAISTSTARTEVRLQQLNHEVEGGGEQLWSTVHDELRGRARVVVRSKAK